MFQLVIGIASIFIVYKLYSMHKIRKQIHLKEEELLRTTIKKSELEVDEAIVEAKIGIKKREEKLDKIKEKL